MTEKSNGCRIAWGDDGKYAFRDQDKCKHYKYSDAKKLCIHSYVCECISKEKALKKNLREIRDYIRNITIKYSEG